MLQGRDKSSKFEYKFTVALVDGSDIECLSNHEPIIGEQWTVITHAVHTDVDDDAKLSIRTSQIIGILQERGEFSIEDLAD